MLVLECSRPRLQQCRARSRSAKSPLRLQLRMPLCPGTGAPRARTLVTQEECWIFTDHSCRFLIGTLLIRDLTARVKSLQFFGRVPIRVHLWFPFLSRWIKVSSLPPSRSPAARTLVACLILSSLLKFLLSCRSRGDETQISSEIKPHSETPHVVSYIFQQAVRAVTGFRRGAA